MEDASIDSSPEGYRGWSTPPDTASLKSNPGYGFLFDPSFLEEHTELPFILDIGAGMGRFLMAEAEKRPENRFLGIDPDFQCAKKNLTKLANRQRREVKMAPTRFFYGSVYQLFPFLPDNCVDLVYISYPDPWFKRRHLKRRLVTCRLFDALKRVLKPGAQVFVQTDIGDYAQTIDLEFKELEGFDIQYGAEALFEGLTTTLYQEKASTKDHSRHCYCLTYH